MSLLPVDVGMGIGATLALGVGVYAYSIFNPRSQVFFPVISRGDTRPPGNVALTFEDGPTPEGTGPVLDRLAEAGVKAAFFLIGANASRYPDLVRRIDAEGHVIGNHSYDHRRLGAARWGDWWRDQLDRTDDVIASIIGKRPALFRPPLGFKSWRMAGPLKERGQTAVTWSRRALDGFVTTAAQIERRLVPAVKPGDIIVLHDGVEPGFHRDPRPTIQAIAPIIHGVRARGVGFQRLDELIGVRPYLAATATARREAPALIVVATEDPPRAAEDLCEAGMPAANRATA